MDVAVQTYRWIPHHLSYYTAYFVQQEEIEAAARAELWREELIEEIEQKVGGLRELEEAGKEEELVQWKMALI